MMVKILLLYGVPMKYNITIRIAEQKLFVGLLSRKLPYYVTLNKRC